MPHQISEPDRESESIYTDGEIAIQLVDYCHQTACGLEYLASLHFIHRDVACRNLLLDAANEIKISDFGMTKFQTSEYYRITDTSDRVPIR